MANKVSPLITDSCAYFNNAKRIMVKLTMPINAKGNNIVPKMTNQKGLSLPLLIADSRLSKNN